MRDRWLREHLEKSDWNDFFYQDTRERVIKLCLRLGIKFTDDPSQQTEMWAQIGDYLALEQEEFNRKKQGKGRPQKMEDRDVELAELVEQEQSRARDKGKSISDVEAIEILRHERKLKKYMSDGPKSQVARGKKKLEALRFHGSGDDEYTTFDLLRADRDKSCGKISD